MDKLMQKAMEKHKIVRYQQSFIDVMTTYKSLLEAENEQLHKPVVMQGLLSDCCQAEVITTEIHTCKNCECSCSQAVGDGAAGQNVRDGDNRKKELGTCVECTAENIETVDYNGHRHMVCLTCDDRLTRYFEEEYD